MNQSSNAEGSDQRQMTIQELRVVVGIAQIRNEDRFNIFYLQLSQALHQNIRQIRQALTEQAETEPHVLLTEYMEREHRIVEAWNLHRFNEVIRYIPEEDVPDTLHNFPLRGAAHDMSTNRGYQFQMPARPLPRRINGIDEHEVPTALEFLEQPNMQAMIRLGGIIVVHLENHPAPVVREEQPGLMTVKEHETVVGGSGNERADDTEPVQSASEQVAAISTPVPLEESVVEKENEEDADMADVHAGEEDLNAANQETKDQESDAADQECHDEDADMADVEDDGTETSDGREHSDRNSESEEDITATQSEDDEVDGMSSDDDDYRSATPEGLEFEDDAVRLEQLEQDYIWGETTEEESDGSDDEYLPPTKKRRL